MRKIVALLFFLSSISLVSLAQETAKDLESNNYDWMYKSPEEIARLRTAKLDKKYNLTDKQREEVYALQLKNITSKLEIKEMKRQGRRMDHNPRKSFNFNKELNQILTPEQRQLAHKQKKKSNIQHKSKSKQNNRKAQH